MTEQSAKAKELRAFGLTYAEIEAVMGLGDSHGSRARKLVLGLGGTGREKADAVPSVRISLWKALEGGRSFKAIEAALAANGIACRKPTKEEGLSPYEGRYDIVIAEKDADDAKRLLLMETDGFTIQALDNLRDITK